MTSDQHVLFLQIKILKCAVSKRHQMLVEDDCSNRNPADDDSAPFRGGVSVLGNAAEERDPH